MNAGKSQSVFLSHSSKDDSFVRELRQKLEDGGCDVLDDSTGLRVGDSLPDKIRELIDTADHVIGVLSQDAVKSGWVRRELDYASRNKSDEDGARIIPLLLGATTCAEMRAAFKQLDPDGSDALESWPAERLGIRVGTDEGAIEKMLPELLAALQPVPIGPGSASGEHEHVVSELADLVLRLKNPKFKLVKNEYGAEVRRPVATASFAYYPSGAAEPEFETRGFSFVAPLGELVAGELSYYLERFYLAPFGMFAKRAAAIEKQLPEWGRSLWDSLNSNRPTHLPLFAAWQALAVTSQRRFTVRLDPPKSPAPNADEATQRAHANALEASTQLLALPWELLHDDTGYLFHDGQGVRVRRALPGPDVAAHIPDEMRKPPLRVLVVCARPESEGVGYIDHRVSVRPLIEALNALGDLAEYKLLAPPTFPALRDELQAALQRGRPYHIVHFDGHGVYDKRHGLGGLVFEKLWDSKSFERREPEIINAVTLGAELRNAGVGLFFLEACQSAKSEENPGASVAGRLLQSGIASVAAMSHSVLVETARRFTAEFYPQLVRGQRVGAAMLAGQRALHKHRQRGWGFRPLHDSPSRDGVESRLGESCDAGTRTVERCPLELDDWFVPVLYQSGDDPQLVTDPPPSQRVRDTLAEIQKRSFGKTPPEPQHTFVGRSRELLAAERLLLERGDRYVVFRGEGGEGKTTLAAELARWLVTTRRMQRAAFVSVEQLSDARPVLTSWGEQISPGFTARADSLDSAEEQIVRTLLERPTVLVLDNLETLLPPPAGSEAAAARLFDPDLLDEILTRCRNLLDRAPMTRLIFTSREALPADCSFAARDHVLDIGRLSLREGMELVSRVLAGPGTEAELPADFQMRADAVQTAREEEIETLVRTVNAHARSLVLLTGELRRQGISATTADLSELMAELERRYPGQREQSLFASVELSLRRLPKEIREKLAPLGVFQGGAVVQFIGTVCEIELRTIEEVNVLAEEFVDVGLAELIPLSVPYLRFDPALAPALLRELRDAGRAAGGWGRAERAPSGRAPRGSQGSTQANQSSLDGRGADEDIRPTTVAPSPFEIAARARWAEAYRQLAGFLQQQRGQDTHLAAHLTLLELPNLLSALRCFAAAMESSMGSQPVSSGDTGSKCGDVGNTGYEPMLLDATPETVIEFAASLESLLQHLNRRAALAEASAIRTRADELRRRLGDTWTQAAFNAAGQHFNRLLDTGCHREAVAAARSLAETAESAGPRAYPGADYDIAMTQFRLGRALHKSGDPQSALTPLATARHRFEELSTTRDREEDRRSAAHMAAVCLTDEGDGLRDLGQLDAAALKYEESIRRATDHDHRRQVAVGRFQLGTVRMKQQRYAEALTHYHASREVTESLGESTAVDWHQIGRVHEESGQWDEAEAAYLKSLSQEVESGNKPGEASSRDQLGVLYGQMPGRGEQAVEFHRQAADIFQQLGLRLEEGRSHNNAAIALQQLGRFDAARDELTLAMECKSEFGLNAEPWTTWAILSDLETEVGNPSAAATARDEALRHYESARRQGWQITLGVFADHFAEPVALLLNAPALGEQLPADLRRQLPAIEASLRQQLTAILNDPDFQDRPDLQALVAATLALLDGTRTPDLWQNPALFYGDAVELKLLLEQLAGH